MNLIPAALKDDAFIKNVQSSIQSEDQFSIWWLGQSGYLIQWNGLKILMDPYLSDSLTKKYAGTSKEHIRISERVVDPSLLTEIKIITASHQHTDHLDGETLRPILVNNPEIAFVIPESIRALAAERGECNLDFPYGMNIGSIFTKYGIKITAVPAAHELLDQNDQGQYLYLGYILQFGKWTIYHSGDTVLFNTMVALLRMYPIDLALLPINGADPSRGVAGNLDPRDAAWLANAIDSKLTIPCHYDMFRFNTEDPALFEKHAQTYDLAYKILKLGEEFVIT